MENLQGHDEWIAKRAGRFTASEIWKLFVEPRTKADKEAGIFSETAMTYIFEKAVETYTGYRKHFTNPAMEHGVANEKEAFDAFCKTTNLPFTYCSKEFYAINDYAGASPDGILYDDLEPIAVLDVKCPQPVTFFEELTNFLDSKNKDEYDGLVRNYYYQLQFQMLATKTPTAFLAYYLAKDFVNAYTGEVEHTFTIPMNNRLFFMELKANQKTHDEIMKRIEKAQAIKNELIAKWKVE